ncbi:hypothetical protein ALC56_02364 [Trachymyrmex septentrionalis]|uniref:Uncharacterized protein n=1 Tax=Trachymyrmex septentrionalis TaxID=34720 RepID=A0A195FSB3_9HYME|nr:hypothetical protein ALC56_02364 [Trachymyrmex septentrionalis]
MGPAVVITVVRRSRSHLKKKRRYETVQLQENQRSQQSRPPPQMVSVDLDSTVFSPLIFFRAYRRRPPSARRANLNDRICTSRLSKDAPIENEYVIVSRDRIGVTRLRGFMAGKNTGGKTAEPTSVSQACFTSIVIGSARRFLEVDELCELWSSRLS